MNTLETINAMAKMYEVNVEVTEERAFVRLFRKNAQAPFCVAEGETLDEAVQKAATFNEEIMYSNAEARLRKLEGQMMTLMRIINGGESCILSEALWGEINKNADRIGVLDGKQKGGNKITKKICNTCKYIYCFDGWNHLCTYNHDECGPHTVCPNTKACENWCKKLS